MNAQADKTESKADKPEPETEKNWWLKFYQDTPFIQYLDNAHREDQEEILAFLSVHTPLPEGAVIYDQCCGVGSISLPLAGQGHTVYGTDLCPQFIDEAKRRAEIMKVQDRAHYLLADATTYTTPSPCDLAVNLYTSFGYGDDGVNLAMLKMARGCLKEGAPFLLDFPNFYLVISSFRKHIVRHIDTATGTLTVNREAAFSPETGRLLQEWTFIEADGKRSCQKSSLAVYLPHQIKDMLRQVGFESIELMGDFHGTPFGVNSPRCIALAR